MTIMRNKQLSLLPWTYFVAAIALFLWPGLRVGPLAAMMLSKNETGVASVDNPVELGHSKSFYLVGPVGYMSEDEIQAYLAEAEARRTQLIGYLGTTAQGNQITVRFHWQSRGADSGFCQPLQVGSVLRHGAFIWPTCSGCQELY